MDHSQSQGAAGMKAAHERARRLAAEFRYAGLLEVRFQLDPDGRAWVSGVTIGLQRIVKWDIIEESLYEKFPENIQLRFWELGIELKKHLFAIVPPHLKSKFKEKE